MGRYTDYPAWLVIKLGILAFFIPIMIYLLLCNFLSMHYLAELDRYDNAALSISSGWPQGKNFNERSVCEVNRLMAAGGDAASYPPFDLWWMIRNWDMDFLAKQAPCN